MHIELKDSVIAFVDILGFKRLLNDEEHFQNLFDVIKNIKEHNTPKSTVKYSQNNNGSSTITTMPAITSFSDCIVLSSPIEDSITPFPLSVRDIVHRLLGLIQQLADSLMFGGYILRGGITRGDLYHKDNVVFGKPLIEAYQLESIRAKTPRILVSDELAKQYNESTYSRWNFLSKDDIDDKYYLNYFTLSFQDPPTRKRYRETTENTINKRKKDISEKVNRGELSQLKEDIKILEKWLHFENYVAKALSEY